MALEECIEHLNDLISKIKVVTIYNNYVIIFWGIDQKFTSLEVNSKK